MKEILRKSSDQLASEWDFIAEKRYSQISEGKDLTYTQTLCPIFTNEISNGNYRKVLDVGCGIGYLTHLISRDVNFVYGIDISKKSIAIAEREYQSENIVYECQDVLKFNLNGFDLCIANMFLMDCLELDKALGKISSIIQENGKFLCTIPNPLVMPRYWGYEKYKWFNYKREIIIEGNFRTSSQGTTDHKTTHVHRPISLYLDLFMKHGFKIVGYREITGNPLSGKLIKKYPRHLFLSFIKA